MPDAVAESREPRAAAEPPRAAQRALALAAALVALAALPGCAPTRATTPRPAGDSAGTDTTRRDSVGAVVFFDDFAGAALDRAKWNVRITGQVFNEEQQAYVDAPETAYIVRGAEAEGATEGALVIQALRRPGFVTPQGQRFDFVSARLDTRDRVEFAYGTASARMKLPAGAGLWPAFWLLGTGEWPATGEIDIMENVGAPEWVSVALHGPGYSGNTPLVLRAQFAAGQGATDWHVYSVDWSPRALAFRLDGQVVYRVLKPMVEQHGPWAFDNPKYIILNLALGGTYPRGVNGVTGPYPGLSPAAIEAIEAGRAKVLVDWVRVTAPVP